MHVLSPGFLRWWLAGWLVCGACLGCGSSDAPAPPQASIAGSPAEGAGGTAADTSAVQPQPTAPLSAQSGGESPSAQPAPNLYPEVVLKTTAGEIRVRLNAEKAPQTVENFLETYAERGFYNETIFHYVDDGFMVAAGGYTAQYEAKPTRTPIYNESDNGLSNRRGTLAMARDAEFAHSATSQFFINLADNPSLDHQDGDQQIPNGYCVFGEVIAGMDVVDRIAKSPVEDREGFPRTPTNPVVIQSIEVVRR